MWTELHDEMPRLTQGSSAIGRDAGVVVYILIKQGFFVHFFDHEAMFNNGGCPRPDNSTIKFTAILWIITACTKMIRCYVR